MKRPLSQTARKFQGDLRRVRIVLMLDIREHFNAIRGPSPDPILPFLSKGRAVNGASQPYICERRRQFDRRRMLIRIVDAYCDVVLPEQTVDLAREPRVVTKFECCRNASWKNR